MLMYGRLLGTSWGLLGLVNGATDVFILIKAGPCQKGLVDQLLFQSNFETIYEF